MSDNVPEDLARALRFAAVVREALPIDQQAEAMMARALQKRAEGYTSRKLTRRIK